MIGAAVAILAWIRWRDTGESVALYESSAFVALTAINVLMIGIVILGKESAFGLDATQPGAAPIYVWTITRGARRRDPRSSGRPAACVARRRRCRRWSSRSCRRSSSCCPRSCCSGGRRSCRRSPERRPSTPPAAASSGRRRSRPGSSLLQVAIFVGFIVAAILLRRLYIRVRPGVRRVPRGGPGRRRVQPAAFRPGPGRRDRGS